MAILWTPNLGAYQRCIFLHARIIHICVLFPLIYFGFMRASLTLAYNVFWYLTQITCLPISMKICCNIKNGAWDICCEIIAFEVYLNLLFSNLNYKFFYWNVIFFTKIKIQNCSILKCTYFAYISSTLLLCLRKEHETPWLVKEISSFLFHVVQISVVILGFLPIRI